MSEILHQKSHVFCLKSYVLNLTSFSCYLALGSPSSHRSSRIGHPSTHSSFKLSTGLAIAALTALDPTVKIVNRSEAVMTKANKPTDI